ncbi:unnamed protein product [Cercopithifilaria johnstoni]|uniref:Alpha-1,3-glucosyltransferase n=1 Tax=Cercopithifilaria johnstoni TaxID=2874296 RepID=A0A8J2MTK0_9BILA|nr:unnamed protein product [Cercopithifilaria johnstoni]
MNSHPPNSSSEKISEISNNAIVDKTHLASVCTHLCNQLRTITNLLIDFAVDVCDESANALSLLRELEDKVLPFLINLDVEMAATEKLIRINIDTARISDTKVDWLLKFNKCKLEMREMLATLSGAVYEDLERVLSLRCRASFPRIPRCWLCQRFSVTGVFTSMNVNSDQANSFGRREENLWCMYWCVELKKSRLLESMIIEYKRQLKRGKEENADSKERNWVWIRVAVRRVEKRIIISTTNEAAFLALMCFAITVQIALSLGSYSGHATPPMYGDYEAQRHWMEITYHLPVNQWYVNSSDNDLNYWGLDYPPLTAYHSWLLGTVANKLNRSWLELHTSRGIETESHKIFMRITVLATYWTVYVSSLLLSIGFFRNIVSCKMFNYCSVAVLYPGLLVMDNGHFQYNHVSLGLFLFSFACFTSNYLKFGSMFFVLALNFKQMELYHALPIATYLLSKSFPNNNRLSAIQRYLSWVKQLFILFITVVTTIGFVWFPFFVTRSDLIQILHRIFPFYRGIFEDKVANFWCSINVLYKLKDNFEMLVLLRMSAIMVLVTNIPWLLCLFHYPTVINFKYGLLASSLSFFLFSFQVHEKSILLVALPGILLWNENPVFVSWLLIISNTSLYPLCIKDGNAIHLALFIFYYIISCSSFSKLSRMVVHGSCLTSLMLCLTNLLFAPPARFPDIFSLLIAVYCFIHFITFFLYINLIALRFRFKKLKTVESFFISVYDS